MGTIFSFYYMARIAGVNLPNNKPLFISLRSIYGIGKKNATDICDKVQIEPTTRTQDLSEQSVIKIRKLIDADYLVEGDLRKEVISNKKRLVNLRCYRGLRHT